MQKMWEYLFLLRDRHLLAIEKLKNIVHGNFECAPKLKVKEVYSGS